LQLEVKTTLKDLMGFARAIKLDAKEIFWPNNFLKRTLMGILK